MLTSKHIRSMVFHMKTTLNIDEQVMVRLKQEAARQGRTMSELVDMALRQMLGGQRAKRNLPPLPSFRSGGALVDIADRDALYQALEGR
jgi:plasmid stability protein